MQSGGLIKSRIDKDYGQLLDGIHPGNWMVGPMV